MDKFDVFGTKYAYDIYMQKYSLNGTETWKDTCKRVLDFCLKPLGYSKASSLYRLLEEAFYERKILPGGRYLRSAGRPISQIKSCMGFVAEDSAEGWSDLLRKVSLALMHGAGAGVEYSKCREEGAPLKRKGGYASGPIPLMKMVDHITAHVMSGGDRRGANLAQLSWKHPDIFKFISAKNWDEEVLERLSKDWNAYAPLKFTNTSVRVGDDFLKGLQTKESRSLSVFDTVCRQMVKTGEPGFICNFGNRAADIVTNACQPGFATVLTPEGIKTFDDIQIGDTVWSGKQWTVIKNKWSNGISPVFKYTTSMGEFIGTADHKVVSRGVKKEVGIVDVIDTAEAVYSSTDMTLDPTIIMDGIVFGDGTVHKASNDLIILYIGRKDKDYYYSEVAPLLVKDRSKAFSRSKNCDVFEVKTNLVPEELPKTYERVIPDRYYRGNNATKISFLRGLFTANGCVTSGRVNLRTASKIQAYQVVNMLSSLGIRANVAESKSKLVKFYNGEYSCRKSYNINLYRDSDKFMNTIGFIQTYKNEAVITTPSNNRYVGGKITSKEFLGDMEVFEITVAAEEHTYWTGGLLVSNCSEYRSNKDSCSCNLVSLNLSKINSLTEFEALTELSSTLAVCANMATYYITNEARKVVEEDNDIGIGLMGVADWFVKRGYKYGEESEELLDWLDTWSNNISLVTPFCNKHSLPIPKRGRAVAPTGSISILGETTGGIEPMFAAAYKRKVLKSGVTMMSEYVIDPIAKRLVDDGLSPDLLEDSYSIPYERRIALQALIQDHCDMGVSSTINLPKWGSDANNESTVEEFKRSVLKYLPRLRGITAFPDGSRGSAQPLTPVKYTTAVKYTGKGLVEDSIQVCDLKGGSCG